MRPNSPSASCYLVILPTKTGATIEQDNIIPFQFMPNSITRAKTANYVDVPIIGRSSPLKSYQSSGATSVNFTLEFFANPEPEDNSFSPEQVKKRVDSIWALTHPIYTDYKVFSPPRCLIRIGKQFAVIGVIKNVSNQVLNTSPWDIGTNVLAHHSTITLTLEELLNMPLSYDEAKAGLESSSQSNEISGTTGQIDSRALPSDQFDLLLGGGSTAQQGTSGSLDFGGTGDIFSGQQGFGVGNSYQVLGGQPASGSTIGGSGINVDL